MQLRCHSVAAQMAGQEYEIKYDPLRDEKTIVKEDSSLVFSLSQFFFYFTNKRTHDFIMNFIMKLTNAKSAKNHYLVSPLWRISIPK